MISTKQILDLFSDENGEKYSVFQSSESPSQTAVIKVIGVGGCGGNAVKHMLAREVEGVEFISANTDVQSLLEIQCDTCLQLGRNITKGLGAGGNPDVGRQSAFEDWDIIADALMGADMVFITAGMGGGTGTGASPIVAAVAKSMNILTVAIVTRPFPFEGKKRLKIADKGILKLQHQVDSLIVVPNEKLLSVLGKKTNLLKAFGAANDILLRAVKGVVDLVVFPGIINADFADVRSVMSEKGIAFMGMGQAKGISRAREAAEQAIFSPLLEDANLQGAKAILVNISAGIDLSLGEFNEVGDTIEKFASNGTQVVIGTVINPTLKADIHVTLIATGLNQDINETASVEPQCEMTWRKRIPDQLPGDNSLSSSTLNSKSVSTMSLLDNLSPACNSLDIDYLDIPTFLRRLID